MRSLAAALFLLSSIGPASGQDYGREGRRPRRERDREREEERAASAAGVLSSPEYRPATLEEVLRNPDDIELNLRYARTLADAGDLAPATAALERVLLVAPNLSEVRLFYAILLVRLDNMAEAERELAALKAQGLAGRDAAELKRLLSYVRRRRRGSSLFARLGAGYQYDDNRNSAPSSDQRLFAGTPVVLPLSQRRQKDTAAVGTADFELERDLGFQAGHALRLSGAYYRSEQKRQPLFNLRAASGSLGFVLRGRGWDLTPEGLFDHVYLGDHTYLRVPGGRLKLAWRAKGENSTYLFGQYGYNEHLNTPELPTADERSGNEITGGVGMDFVPRPDRRFNVEYAQTRRNAAKAYNAYDRGAVSLSATKIWRSGVFCAFRLRGEHDVYAQNDASVSVRARRDYNASARWAVGVPMAPLWSALDGLAWTFTYDFQKTYSNLTNFDYRNHRLGALLTYSWSL